MASRDELQQIAALIKAGQKAEAGKRLLPLLKADPQNAAAWWLLANAVANPEHQRRALDKVLQLRPGDERAQKMLDKLSAKADDPFDDPSNPFIAAKKSATQEMRAGKRSLLHKTAADDPFSSDTDDDSDPFADVRSQPTGWINEGQPRRPPAPARGSAVNSSLLILGVVVVIAIIAVVATLIYVNSRGSVPAATVANSDVPGADDRVFSTEVDCGSNSVTNINDDEGARLPARAIDLGTLRFNQSATADFLDGAEIHRYSFDGSAGQRITIEMWAEDVGIDPQIEVYDIDGFQIAFCDDRDLSEGNLDAYMEIRLPRSGTYTIVARQFGFSEGTYRIMVR
ncbi:MAG: PPC domain-containing protein [Chloroflexi bacterium]|nr:PPC domain-containing protein [Chloroflexota bacterium]